MGRAPRGFPSLSPEPINNVLTALPSWGDGLRRRVVIFKHGGHLSPSRQVGVFRHTAIEWGGGGGLRMGEAQGRSPEHVPLVCVTLSRGWPISLYYIKIVAAPSLDSMDGLV